MTESQESSATTKNQRVQNGNILDMKPEKYGTDYNFKREIVWFNVTAFFLMHLFALYGVYLMPKAHPYSILFAMAIAAAGAQGITAGAHRLYAHRAYKAKPALRFLLIYFQTLAGQNSMYTWVRDHRLHHKYSDTDADPHNAKRGFFFSHMGWLMSRKHPLVRQHTKSFDMSDLEADNMVMFQKKYFKQLFVVNSMIIPVIVPMYFWQETLSNALFICFFTRYVIQLNGTWLVNSWAHFFGTRPYNKKIVPVETKFVSVVTMGEGWHNYHHTFPWDYKASELGAPANLTRILIDFWAYLGLAYDLRSVSDRVVERTLGKLGDGSVPSYSLVKKLEDNSQSPENRPDRENQKSITLDSLSHKMSSITTTAASPGISVCQSWESQPVLA